MGYCEWADTDRLHKVYHDTEWGIPVHDDRRMFEHLALECMQCGLSWGLMLKKREIFRTCFHHFDYDRIAGYDEKDVCIRDMIPAGYRSAMACRTGSART